MPNPYCALTHDIYHSARLAPTPVDGPNPGVGLYRLLSVPFEAGDLDGLLDSLRDAGCERGDDLPDSTRKNGLYFPSGAGRRAATLATSTVKDFALLCPDTEQRSSCGG
jgi:hypothetical protein